MYVKITGDFQAKKSFFLKKSGIRGLIGHFWSEILTHFREGKIGDFTPKVVGDYVQLYESPLVTSSDNGQQEEPIG